MVVTPVELLVDALSEILLVTVVCGGFYLLPALIGLYHLELVEVLVVVATVALPSLPSLCFYSYLNSCWSLGNPCPESTVVFDGSEVPPERVDFHLVVESLVQEVASVEQGHAYPHQRVPVLVAVDPDLVAAGDLDLSPLVALEAWEHLDQHTVA